MNFFDILRILFFKKHNSVDNVNCDDLQSFTPFMINRWLSFYDNQRAIFVNETLNKFSGLYDDKSDSFKFYSNLIPTLKFKKINYVKKNKDKTTDKEDNKPAIIARNNLISTREVEMYIDLLETNTI